MFFPGHCNLPLTDSGFRLGLVQEMLLYVEIPMVCINILTEKMSVYVKYAGLVPRKVRWAIAVYLGLKGTPYLLMEVRFFFPSNSCSVLNDNLIYV